MKGIFKQQNSIIQEIGLEQIGISDYLTASGVRGFAKVYKGNILFFDEELEVPILATNGNFSLAGMEMFHDCRIIIERNKNLVEIVNFKPSSH